MVIARRVPKGSDGPRPGRGSDVGPVRSTGYAVKLKFDHRGSPPGRMAEAPGEARLLCRPSLRNAQAARPTIDPVKIDAAVHSCALRRGGSDRISKASTWGWPRPSPGPLPATDHETTPGSRVGEAPRRAQGDRRVRGAGWVPAQPTGARLAGSVGCAERCSAQPTLRSASRGDAQPISYPDRWGRVRKALASESSTICSWAGSQVIFLRSSRRAMLARWQVVSARW
jgi:hypothetical protein